MARKNELAAILSTPRSRSTGSQPMADEVQVEAPPAPATPRAGNQAKKVRITADLVVGEFRDLRTWREDTAEQLDTARVTVQDTVRLLVRQLLSDPALQQTITEALRRELQ